MIKEYEELLDDFVDTFANEFLNVKLDRSKLVYK